MFICLHGKIRDLFKLEISVIGTGEAAADVQQVHLEAQLILAEDESPWLKCWGGRPGAARRDKRTSDSPPYRTRSEHQQWPACTCLGRCSRYPRGSWPQSHPGPAPWPAPEVLGRPSAGHRTSRSGDTPPSNRRWQCAEPACQSSRTS